MVAHAIVVFACKQFVLLCFMYLELYSFNITLSWSGRTDRRTDGQGDSYIPPQTLFAGGIINQNWI
jgi:hypothetical protein